MTFFDRYTALCARQGMQPMSQKAAKAFGVTRATIVAWGQKNTIPKGETLVLIANHFGVSSDYLLGRTDDPTDYAAAVFPQAAVSQPRILTLYNQLDGIDQVRVESYVEGILSTDKYRTAPLAKMG